ncbi:hypothetical protein HBI95_195590 [Parastagonospora nodorum]|nr:hypothetical protein HBI95_195590 [Parastagonospora nodorum]KAH5049241.1 hypothetical protein HBH96_201380 [Parastagonospora nodorum]KAH5754115.1 hypothetical protein HBI97_222200 [Parastagonospora nodorum]KAH5791881.1 hypothetical protein HBI96_201800 [Parastagonospora nodorum]KAH5801416.1 hypothetical protein HBI94_210650 [Parastagonospora nodorum]
MLFGASDLQSCLLLIIWANIHTLHFGNPLFRHVLDSKALLLDLFTGLSLSFCPGLWTLLNLAGPPTLQWLRDHHSDAPLNVWGVYLLLLEKEGSRAITYIGSGTAASRGLRARIEEHHSGKCPATWVQDAMRNGWDITHTILLATCPIPSPEDVPVYRLVVVALESALAALFWTFRRLDHEYGYTFRTSWTREELPYDGACTHNPIGEPVYGNFHLSKDELKQMAAETRERNRIYQLEYARELRKNPTEQYKKTQKANNIKQRPGTKARQQASVRNKLYECKTCNVSCRDMATLVRHNATPRHRRMVEKGADAWKCCGTDFKFESNYNKHITTKSHLAKHPGSSCMSVLDILTLLSCLHFITPSCTLDTFTAFWLLTIHHSILHPGHLHSILAPHHSSLHPAPWTPSQHSGSSSFTA